MDDKVDIVGSSGLGEAINYIDLEPITRRTNNDMDMGLDIGVSGGAINKTDIELNVS